VFGRVKLAITCLIGIAVGLISARYVAGGGFDLVTLSQGPWKTWTSAGLNTMDPYTKAHFLAAGRLVDNRREVVEYEARSDGAGSPLDTACSYSIAGRLDWARWWSISVSQNGVIAANTKARLASLHSGETIYEADGTAIIYLSSQPHTGNWLAMPSSGDVNLVLRFYDPAPVSRAHPNTMTLPQITRETCQ